MRKPCNLATDQVHHVCRVGINVRVKIKDNSKNGDCGTYSEPFIPPHIYDTWHREKRENIKCVEKSTWLRKDISIKVMLPRVERHSGPWGEGQ